MHERSKKFYQDNIDRIKAWRDEYRAKFPEITKENRKRWYRKNKDRYLGYVHNRRARIAENGGSYTIEELWKLYEAQDRRCFHCSKFISLTNSDTCHIDHWIPLSRGGSNNIDNIRLLCPYCNLSKNDQLPSEWHPNIYPAP